MTIPYTVEGVIRLVAGGKENLVAEGRVSPVAEDKVTPAVVGRAVAHSQAEEIHMEIRPGVAETAQAY